MLGLLAAVTVSIAIGVSEPPAIAGARAADAARAYRDAHGAAILAEFAELLAIPNVAHDDENIRRNAAFIAEAFGRRGVRMDLLEVEGAPPIVVGEIDVPGAARTIGIYVHYDGQPVDADRWTSPPWTPTLFTAAIDEGGVRRPLPAPGEAIDPEWRLYARAAGDDKAPLAALLAALDALAAAELPVTSNIKFLFEGEEEAGSPHLREYFETYGEGLRADVWLICDGPVHQSRRPQLVFGVRGIVSLEMTVYGANRYLHSGHYGNWAPNPALQLARLLAGMKDDRGRVVITGFYDNVAALTRAERQALETVPDVDVELLRQFGLATCEIEGVSLVRSTMMPSLNVRGFVSGAVGAEARNAIPSEATAAIDIRLIKGDDPERMLDLFETHVRGQGYHVVREAPDQEVRRSHERIVRIVREGGYPASRTAMDLPFAEPLIAAAVAASGGEEVVLMPTLGGSLPLYLFEELLETPTIIVPIANHDDNQHGPDENIRLANLWYGVDLMAEVLAMPAAGN